MQRHVLLNAECIWMPPRAAVHVWQRLNTMCLRGPVRKSQAEGASASDPLLQQHHNEGWATTVLTSTAIWEYEQNGHQPQQTFSLQGRSAGGTGPQLLPRPKGNMRQILPGNFCPGNCMLEYYTLKQDVGAPRSRPTAMLDHQANPGGCIRGCYTLEERQAGLITCGLLGPDRQGHYVLPPADEGLETRPPPLLPAWQLHCHCPWLLADLSLTAGTAQQLCCALLVTPPPACTQKTHSQADGMPSILDLDPFFESLCWDLDQSAQIPLLR